MKHFIVLTGPQGSGNHMWSKIFSLHKDVYGWSDLNKEFWIGHDREPFNAYWKNISALKDFDWQQSDYYVSSISVPYMENGVATVPKINEFIQCLESLGIKATVCVIGRDKNILSMQEQRLRLAETYHQALEVYQNLPMDKTYFLSHELLILYRHQYLNKIRKDLNFPIDVNDEEVENILGENANKKYLRPIEDHWVDELARNSSRKWHE